MSKASERAQICAQLGCTVTFTGNVDLEGVSYPTYRIEARNNEHLVQVFNEMARAASTNDPAIREIASRYLADAREKGPAERELYLARRIHKYVQETCSFQREEVETSRPPAMTFALGSGDCDEQACLVASLAWACGLSAVVAPLRDSSGEISHVCAVIGVGSSNLWAETTVGAKLGEHPLAAAQRLGLASRSDIVG